MKKLATLVPVLLVVALMLLVACASSKNETTTVTDDPETPKAPRTLIAPTGNAQY